MSDENTTTEFSIKSTSRGQKPGKDGEKQVAAPRTTLFTGGIDLSEFENGEELGTKLVRFGIETILRKELTGALNKVFNETGSVDGYKAPNDTQAVAIIERVLAGKVKKTRAANGEGAKAKTAKLKAENEQQAQAIVRFEELRSAYKSAVEGGDEKAIKKAQKALLAG